MLNKIKESLLILDEQLEILWRNYLTARPSRWLWELEHTRAELVEARKLYEVIHDLKARVHIVRSIINDDAGLDPVRKEN